MQKPKNVLLTLNSEERENCQSFIRRRLKTLDIEHLGELQALSQKAKQFIRRWQLEKGQYTRSPSRSGKLMVKLHEIALADMQSLIKEIDQTSYELNSKAQRDGKDGKDGKKSDSDQKADDLIVNWDDEELEHAAEFIKEKTTKLRAPDLKIFRDSCQEIIDWWESECGEIESLHRDQVGNVNTASGRLAIRQKRDEYQYTVLNPLKIFFREINISYQRAVKEAADKARVAAARAQNMG